MRRWQTALLVAIFFIPLVAGNLTAQTEDELPRKWTAPGDAARPPTNNLPPHVKQSVLQCLSSGRTVVRVNAMLRLREHPVPDSVDILVRKGLLDKHVSARQAAYSVLLELRNDATVCASVQSILVKRLRGETRSEPIAPLIEVLMMSGRTGGMVNECPLDSHRSRLDRPEPC